MITKDLHKAYVEVKKLVIILGKDKWLTDHLSSDLEHANRQVIQIVQNGIEKTMYRLKSYEEEAQLWANNNMRNLAGNPISISEKEQNKVRTQLKHIQKTITTLKELLDE